MTFLSPIWLLGLASWAAVAAALLLGRRPRQDVPFLRLWRGPIPHASPRRRVTPPPPGVALAMLAALAAILAAAGPAWRQPGVGGVVVIVDTGVSMSARAGDASRVGLRFQHVAADVVAALGGSGEVGATGGTVAGGTSVSAGEPIGRSGPSSVTVVDVPQLGRARVAVGDLAAYVAALAGNATDSRETLDRAVRRELADPTAGAVLVITDQSVPIGDARVVRVAPAAAARSVGIRAFSIRRTPRPQAMVRLSNETWGGNGGASAMPHGGDANTPAIRGRGDLPANVTVRVSAGGAVAERVIPTPGPGESRDVFIDLPSVSDPRANVGSAASTALPATAAPPAILASPATAPAATASVADTVSTATATLVGWDDDLPADDRADLAAEADWPALEPAGPIGDLRRLVDLFGRARAPGERSVRVRLTSDMGALGDSPGVDFPPPGSPAATVRAASVAAHPITAAVPSWDGLDLPAVAGRGPPAGFAPILIGPAGPLAAVRTTGGGVGPEIRQVWCGLAVDGWASRPEYVAFFSAAFAWAGRADDLGDGLAVHPLAELTAEWQPAELAPATGPVATWPGLYRRRGDGALRAFGPAEIRSAEAAAARAGAAGGVANGPEVVGGVRQRVAMALHAGDHFEGWSPWLTVAALALAVAAVFLWPRVARQTSVGQGQPAVERVRDAGRGRSS